jgi:hypothetical protein
MMVESSKDAHFGDNLFSITLAHPLKVELLPSKYLGFPQP